MTDYYTFCERYAQRCAARRAELEEDELLLRRSSDLRRRDLQEQSEPQQQSTSYQLPVTDAELDRRINDCITKYIEDNRIREAIGEAIGMLHHELQEHVEQKLGESRAEREHAAKKIAGLEDEIAGLRADLTIMRSINASRNVFGCTQGGERQCRLNAKTQYGRR
jgi:hypothetical protein